MNRNMRLLVLSAAFISFVLLGCTMQESTSIGCCEQYNDGTGRVICDRLVGGSPSIGLLSTNSCNPDEGTCDINIRRSAARSSGDTSGGSSGISVIPSVGGEEPIPRAEALPSAATERVVVPICTTREAGCLLSDCLAQTCGSFRYNPTPGPSFGDVSRISTTPGMTTRVARAQNAENIQGLYGAACHLVETGDRLNKFFQNTKGSFVNTFRFGIGDTFDEFEKYRWLFPTSDVFCNVNPVSFVGKDRYMNYLLSPLLFARKMAGSAFIPPADRVADYNFCPTYVASPYLAPRYAGGNYPGYKMSNVTRNQYALSVPDASSLSSSPPSLLPSSIYSHLTLDRAFYRNFLSIMYKTEIDESLARTGMPAPFECTNGMECSSAQCNFFDYSRGICKRAGGDSSGWVECNCNPPARTCFGGKKYMDYSWHPPPTTAAQLQEYADEYLENGRNFSVVETFSESDARGINFAYGWLNPSCSGGVGSFGESPNGDIDDHGEAPCTKVAGQNQLICNRYWGTWDGVTFSPGTSTGAGVYAITCDLGAGGAADCGSGRTCTYIPGVHTLSCSRADSVSTSDCTVSGSRLDCRSVVGSTPINIACMIGRSGLVSACVSDELRRAPEGSGSLSGCSYNSDANELSCTLTTNRPRSDCAEFAPGRIGCGAGAAGSEETFTVDFDQQYFPTDIFFFGDKRPGGGSDDNLYIGYSLLSKEAFGDTDFAMECGLVEGTDYVVKAATHDGEYGLNEEHAYESTTHSGTFYYPGYRPPKPVPEWLGRELKDGGDCHWDGDDNREYVIALKYILIKSRPSAPGSDREVVGTCELDPVTNMPRAKVFGWCEGCSYATLAKEKVVSGDSYIPYTKTESRKADGTGNSQTSNVCTNARAADGGILPGVYCPTADVPDLYQPWLTSTNSNPDSIFLEEKQRQYLQEGVLPIFDITDDSNWVDIIGIDGRGGLSDAITNHGPSVLIVDKVSSAEALNPAKKEQILYRLSRARTLCDKCLLSLKVSNGEPESAFGVTRLANDHDTLESLFMDRDVTDSLDRRILNAIDVISFEFYPNEYTTSPSGTEPPLYMPFGVIIRTADVPEAMPSPSVSSAFSSASFAGATASSSGVTASLIDISPGTTGSRYPICSNSQTMNEFIFSKLENISHDTLVQYGKLSLITDFSIDDWNAECWGTTTVGGRTLDKKQAFISYIFAQQKRLTKTGLMGIVYSDISRIESTIPAPDGSLRYEPQFCSLEHGTKWLVADEPITIYSRTYTSDTVMCTPCTDTDIAIGRCTRTCTNGRECALMDPPTPGVSVENQRCPDRMMPEPCTPCSGRTGDVQCRRNYPDGTSDTATFLISSLSDLTPDVIASIPYGEKCCLQDVEGRNYTYVKEMSSGKATAPIIFSSSGNPSQDCGVPDYSVLNPTFCSSNNLPITPHSITCSIPLSVTESPLMWEEAGSEEGAAPRYEAITDIYRVR